MPMKLEFTSDVRGMEQLSKALEQQQKLLNENAAAAERLNRAQKGMFDTDSPGSKRTLEQFKETASSIRDITGALSQLDRSQGGLQSFMNLFSSFRKDLGDANKDQKNNLFTNLALQVDHNDHSFNKLCFIDKNPH